MYKLLKFLVLTIIFLQLSSCTPSAPYEIKSPCVSAEIPDGININLSPCIRRPVNSTIDVA